MMRWLIGALLGLFVLLQYRLWFAEGGLAEANRLSAELAAAETENTKLSERNEALAREVIALQAGTEAVEKNARENLGLIKEGEVYYQFVEEPDTPWSDFGQWCLPLAQVCASEVISQSNIARWRERP